jgi:hypothetical protein
VGRPKIGDVLVLLPVWVIRGAPGLRRLVCTYVEAEESAVTTLASPVPVVGVVIAVWSDGLASSERRRRSSFASSSWRRASASSSRCMCARRSSSGLSVPLMSSRLRA